MSRVKVRPTTPQDVETFLGKSPPYTFKGETGLVDGEIVGIGGIAKLPDGTALAFLHLAPGAERYAVTLHRTAKRIIAETKARGVRKIVALADLSIEAAERWLLRLGFEPVEVEGEVVYIWQH